MPVGQDQLQHLELAREIVRKFNRRYGDTFDEPQALLTETPKILGLDGQAKMSKSLGNTIGLGESDDAIWKKLAVAATDPARVRRTDPGDPDKCNVYTLHTFFTPEDEKQWVRQGCTTAGIGCIDCKKALHKNLVDHLVPIPRQATGATRPARPGDRSAGRQHEEGACRGRRDHRERARTDWSRTGPAVSLTGRTSPGRRSSVTLAALVVAALGYAGSGRACSESRGPERAVAGFVQAVRQGDADAVLEHLGPATRAHLENAARRATARAGSAARFDAADMLELAFPGEDDAAFDVATTSVHGESATVRLTVDGVRETVSLVRHQESWKIELPNRQESSQGRSE